MGFLLLNFLGRLLRQIRHLGAAIRQAGIEGRAHRVTHTLPRMRRSDLIGLTVLGVGHHQEVLGTEDIEHRARPVERGWSPDP